MTAPRPATGDACSTSGDQGKSRRVFGTAVGAHALHDGYTDLLLLLLPVWQAEFGLSYAVLGLLRAMLVGTMALFQIPASFLAERYGNAAVLAGGTALAGLCFCLAGASGGTVALGAALVLGGIGSSAQHPVASSMVARAYAGSRSRAALGTYNFAGDLGKMALPAIAAAMMWVLPWRPTVILLGALGVVGAAAIILLTPNLRVASSTVDIEAPRGAGGVWSRGFALLLALGILDAAMRMGFLVLLPFLLQPKGADLQTIGFALALVFAGGAAGKLACGFLGARFGVLATVLLTEGLTAVGVVAVLWLSLPATLVLLPLIGICLNGTSSVLYGSVPELVPAQSRGRAFSVFYTGVLGAGATAPILFGLLGDATGLTASVLAVAAVGLSTLPLAGAVNSALSVPQRP